jgi:hypothetical protein
MPGNLVKDFSRFIKETISRGSGVSHQEQPTTDKKGGSPVDEFQKRNRGGGMRINFERTGGFTGMHLAVEVMTESLTPEEADKLETLVESSRFFDLPEMLQAQTGMGDRFQYKVTVERGDRNHTVETSESAAPEELQRLIEHLTNVARTHRI